MILKKAPEEKNYQLQLIYRVSTTKPGHRHITHIKIIYELL
jgi:hypothetical protein